MRTDGAIITNAGQELLSYALANNKQVNFTKVKLGKGDVNTFDEAKKLTDIVSFYKQIPITSIARNNAGIVRIRSSFTNADFPLQVVLKEIGVFAVVEGKSEVLFGYVNDGDGESFPPGSSGNIVERVRDIYVGVSTNTQVTAVIDRSMVYATIYDLDEEIAKCAKKITRVNPGNGIHGGGTLGEDITISIKSNDTSINLDATNGITLKKTTSWLNDAAQLFTAKGALNLFNTLTTNFTDAINVAKEALRLDIVKKTDKGGYEGSSKDLKNDIDGKIPYYSGIKISGIHYNPNVGLHWYANPTTSYKFWDTGNFDPNDKLDRGGLTGTALELKNWLVTNYTTLMNNIRDNLTNLINTKLSHGGYDKTAQDLKNDVDGKIPYFGSGRITGIHKNPNVRNLYWYDLESNGYMFWDTGNFDPNDKLNKTEYIKDNETLQELISTKDTVYKFSANSNGKQTYIRLAVIDKVIASGRSGFSCVIDGASSFGYPLIKKFVVSFSSRGVSPGDITVPSNCLNVKSLLGNSGSESIIAKIVGDKIEVWLKREGYSYETYIREVVISAATTIDMKTITEISPYTENCLEKLPTDCPYNIDDVFTTTSVTPPSTIWLGTTWEKISGKYLKGTSGNENSKVLGGSNTKQIKTEHMAPHDHPASQDSHIHTQPPHNHISNYHGTTATHGGRYPTGTGQGTAIYSSDAGGENTGAAQPAIHIGSTGGGVPLDIQPEYYTVHYWRRAS